MIRTITNHTIRFISILLIQVLILNNVHLGIYLNPYIYPLVILLLPIQMPHWLLMLLSLILGLSVDMFTQSPGVHSAAAVLAGFVRPYVLLLLTPRNGYESSDKPRISSLGISWFVSYASIIVFLHHLFYFYLEVFSFANAYTTFLRVIVSFLGSMVLIIIYEYLFGRAKRKSSLAG